MLAETTHSNQDLTGATQQRRRPTAAVEPPTHARQWAIGAMQHWRAKRWLHVAGACSVYSAPLLLKLVQLTLVVLY